MNKDRVVAGIDVSKERLDVAMLPGGELLRSFNNAEGIAELIRKLKAENVDLVVLEATGGYEMQAVSAIAGAGLRVAVVNPRQVRDYARAMGRLAKTDRIDAQTIATFALAVDPEILRLPDEQAAELQALVVRRGQLMAMRVREVHRLELARGAMREQLKAHVAWLQNAIDEIDGDLGQTVACLACLARQGRVAAELQGNRPGELGHAHGGAPGAGPTRSQGDHRSGRFGAL